MTQTVNEREDPLNLGGGGWASSIPLRTWSSYHRRQRGAPMSKRRYRDGPKTEYEVPRKQPKQHRIPGPWFQPPRGPYWALYSNWGRCRGPWRPPLIAFQSPLCPAQMIRAYGLHPLCVCCCSCWSGPWNPGWERPPGRKKRWGRRGRGLRRHPRRSFPRNPPIDLSKMLRPVNLYGWRAPGMRAPRNTTQFIMNQVYEDMRQQEKLERQQAALRAQQAQAGGISPGDSTTNDAPHSGVEEDSQLPEDLYGFLQDPSLTFSPAPVQQNQSPTPGLVDEEEKNVDDECDEEVCDEKEESEEEEEEEEEVDRESEDEDVDEEEVEEAETGEEGVEDQEEDVLEEAGLEEGEQREEDKFLPLGMPLSILVGDEEERENFMNYDYLSQEQIIPHVPEADLFMVPDISH
ncbi:coiled-coil domain-containing glutamate-rich protein 1 [Apodemus sylvaticus]|uniref:coiled-coil domain-containing glutamate-rich protein 1 n=1 Tax=Apodemus sylvaticus TaxID=10129 RepID=UPI0022440E7A|nr:coiled-coil domain-containing glutamate-rich protein 1 [Apodemus sylvaticus]